MAQRYIYLSDELNARLKKEPNVSKLIQDLLIEHFRKLNPETMSPEEIRKEISRRRIHKEYQDKLEKLEMKK